ncbi:MAG: hypothetical protein QOG16_769 [Actinomycetota bacterium]|jgi:hypothetical protein|nr:hypothetical protein [Actinomycetota bacterium]
MRKALLLVTAALLALPASMAAGSPAPAALAPAPMFVGGGTLVSNGIFFPGTAIENNGELVGVPYQIEPGQDIELTNLDNGDIANCHQLRSIKRRPNGRPLFQTPRLCGPGESGLALTSLVKPGIYDTFCPIHYGMYALIEIKA